MYIGFKENSIFIPTKGATPIDTIDKLIEGTITMVNCLLAQDKSFILTLTTDSEDRTSVSEIPVVCEFPEVFPEDVAYLPPERDVEFSIYLIPGTAPVSMLHIKFLRSS